MNISVELDPRLNDSLDTYRVRGLFNRDLTWGDIPGWDSVWRFPLLSQRARYIIWSTRVPLGGLVFIALEAEEL